MTQLEQPRALSAVLPARRPHDGKVAGVCAGVAQRWDVDPTLVRVAALVLAVSGGLGAVLYLAGWLWMPLSEGSEPAVAKVLPGAETWPLPRVAVAVGLASLAALVVTGQVLPFGWGPLVILLVAAAVARHLQRSKGDEASEMATPPVPSVAPPLPDPSTDFGRAVHAWHDRLHALQHGTTPRQQLPGQGWPGTPASGTQAVARRPDSGRAPSPGRGSHAASAPARRRRRSSWAFSVVVWGLAGLAWVLVDLVATDAPLLLLASSSLAVLSLGLLLGTWWGRPRLTVLAGLVLAVVVAVGLAPDVPGEPTQVRTWTSPSSVPVELSVQGQSVEVDASSLDLTNDHQLAATVQGGALTIDLPDDLPWTITYDLRGGTLTAPDDTTAGWGTGEISGGSGSGPRLTITLRVTAGAVMVS